MRRKTSVRGTRLGMLAITLFCSSTTLGQVAGPVDEPAGVEPPPFRLLTPWGDPAIDGLWDHRSPLGIERPEKFADRATLTLDEIVAWRQEAFAREITEGRGKDPISDLNQGHNAFWLEPRHDLTDDPRTALLVDPATGKLPELTAAARAQLEAEAENPRFPFRGWGFPFEDPLDYLPAGPEETGLTERCLVGYGGPPIYAGIENQLLRIVQTEGDILLFHEDMHTARVVHTDGRPAPPDELRTMLGYSTGSWDGDSLVVTTTHFSEDRPSYWDPRHGPVGSGEDLRLVERFTRISEDRLRYEYTIDDEKNYMAPFTVRLPMRAAQWNWYEYSCHERNDSLSLTLKGARFLERSKGLEE